MKLTTIGIYNYYPSLFDELIFPAGIDRDTAINAILERSGEFEVLYSNPEFFKFLIGVWSKKHAWTFERYVQLYETQYNPLDNYDRHEEYEDNRSNKNTNVARGNTNTTGSRDDERKVSAFDSSVYEPSNKDVESSSTNSNTSGITNSTGEETLKHDAHLWGNIGVTSAMELFEAQQKLLNTYNMYDEIAGLFIDEFCVLVYI